MPIVFTPISSHVVNQHPVATIDDEPIENVDPVTPDVDLVASNIVMDIPLRRSKRVCRPAILDNYTIYLQEHEYDVGDVSNSTTYKKVIISPQSNFWINTMKDEMTSMSQNKVWSLEYFPDSYRLIGCKSVFKTKRDAKRQIERYKARLVAKGYSQ